MPKKSTKRIAAKASKPVEITVTYIPGGAQVNSYEDAVEALTMMEDAQAAIKPIQDFIDNTRRLTTGYAHAHAVKTIQLDGRYWRKIQRMTRFFVATPADMPKPKPKGAKSLREIVKDKKTATGKPLWNFITKRVPDKRKIDEAVALGYLTEKELGKAYVEVPQATFIQRYVGEAMGDDEDDE